MKGIKFRRLVRVFDDGCKIPRKVKNQLLGRRMSKKKLRELLASVQIVRHKYPEPAEILPFPFCPKCGCSVTRSSGNMAEYPELWVRVRCARCNFLVAEADNSPMVHVLELDKSEWSMGEKWGLV